MDCGVGGSSYLQHNPIRAFSCSHSHGFQVGAVICVPGGLSLNDIPFGSAQPHPVETSNKVRIRKCLRLLTFWVDHVMAGPLVTFSLNSIN